MKNETVMPSSIVGISLNNAYSFDNFVVGKCNQHAYMAAKMAAEKPGMAHNPIFIYGPMGVGKTHLLQAIGNYTKSNGKIAIYTTIEHFMNDFTYNLRNQSMDLFRENYRSCDVLLIDEIQFLSDKPQTQEELFHTFNELHSAGKQIVLTSDKPLKMINGLEDRLKSRFGAGLIVDIGLPELETKIAIIQKKCDTLKFSLNDEMINQIAENASNDIREIESYITNLEYRARII